MVFGKLCLDREMLAPLCVSNHTIEYIESYRYLGFHIISNLNFKFSSSETLRSFFGAVNSVLTAVRRPMENVLMQLLYSNCVPILTYGAAVRDLNAAEMQRYNVAVNNAVRRIFGFRYWQSIRQLREFYCQDPIEVMFAKARKRFLDTLQNHDNGLLQLLHSLLVDIVD